MNRFGREWKGWLFSMAMMDLTSQAGRRALLRLTAPEPAADNTLGVSSILPPQHV